MEERSSGIILRTRPLTETSLIVQWITPDLGRISTVAKGARRSKSPFRGKLDLFYEAEFSFQRSRRSELHNLREVSLRDTHARLRNDLEWLHHASYFAVLLEKSTETESPIPELYELMRAALLMLPLQGAHAQTIFAFELKLLRFLGYDSDLAGLARETRRTGEQLREAPLGDAPRIQGSAQISQELNRFLRGSIGTMLERLPVQRERALARVLH